MSTPNPKQISCEYAGVCLSRSFQLSLRIMQECGITLPPDFQDRFERVVGRLEADPLTVSKTLGLPVRPAPNTKGR